MPQIVEVHALYDCACQKDYNLLCPSACSIQIVNFTADTITEAQGAPKKIIGVLLCPTEYLCHSLQVTLLQWHYPHCTSTYRCLWLSTTKLGDNVLGSVHPYVCLCALSWLNRLTFDLDFWYECRPWPWLCWECRSRSYGQETCFTPLLSCFHVMVKGWGRAQWSWSMFKLKFPARSGRY